MFEKITLRGKIPFSFLSFVKLIRCVFALFFSYSIPEDTATSMDHDSSFTRMLVNSNGPAGLSMFHSACSPGGMQGSSGSGASGIGGRPGLPVVPPDAISSIGQPYSADVSHYGPLYYASNYASFKANNRAAPYPRTSADTYYNMYQNFYRTPAVPNSYDTR